MAKRKLQEVTDTAAEKPVEETQPTAVSEQPPQHGADIQQPGNANSADLAQPSKSKWAAKLGSWADYEAGVKLIEDRKNRSLTIKFDEKPSDAVRAVMKDPEHGFRFDPDDQVWYKRINAAKPVQARREVEELVFEVANMIRQEKGLEQKKSFSLGM